MTGFQIAGLAFTGFFAGTFGTIVGIGGGVLFVPVFLLFFNFTPQQASGTSLFAVFFNALAGAISYLRQKRVDLRAGIKFTLATIPGAFLGTWLTRYLTITTFGIIFGVFLILMSSYVFLRKAPDNRPVKLSGHTRFLTDALGHSFSYSPREGGGILLSFFVGILSSLLGIGGGIIHVPAMIYLLGFPVHIATATSQFVLTGTAFFGGFSHLTIGDVEVLPGLLVGISAIPGALLGAAISRRLQSNFIIRLLAAALLLVGIRLLLKSTGVF